MKKLFFSLCVAFITTAFVVPRVDAADDNEPIFYHTRQIICEGRSYIMGGRAYSEPGVYLDTSFSFSHMRDSITELVLDVLPASYVRMSDVILNGETYTFGDTILRTEGVYERVLQAANGCDSIIHFQLGVLFPPCDTVRTHIKDYICEGAEYNFCGRLISEAGVYTDTVPKADNTCDSIVTLELSVYPNSEFALDKTMYTDESFTLSARLVDTTFTHPLPGRYEHTVVTTNRNGCDSTITLTITTVDRETTSDIPTMFSPYEGIKDVFLRGRDLELYIYDRYGLLVRHCGVGEGWDGRYKDKMADPGVYIYVAKYTNGEVKKGTIEVIKEE